MRKQLIDAIRYYMACGDEEGLLQAFDTLEGYLESLN